MGEVPESRKGDVNNIFIVGRMNGRACGRAAGSVGVVVGDAFGRKGHTVGLTRGISSGPRAVVISGFIWRRIRRVSVLEQSVASEKCLTWARRRPRWQGGRRGTSAGHWRGPQSGLSGQAPFAQSRDAREVRRQGPRASCREDRGRGASSAGQGLGRAGKDVAGRAGGGPKRLGNPSTGGRSRPTGREVAQGATPPMAKPVTARTVSPSAGQALRRQARWRGLGPPGCRQR